jgi:hypothetical protein
MNYVYSLLLLRVGYVLFTKDIAVSKLIGKTTDKEVYTNYSRHPLC